MDPNQVQQLKDYNAMPPAEQQKLLAQLPEGHPLKEFAALPPAERSRVLNFSISPETQAGMAGSGPDVAEQVKQNPFRALQIPFEAGSRELAARQAAVQKETDASGQPMTTGQQARYAGLGMASDASRLVSGALSPAGLATTAAAVAAPEIVGPAMLIHGGINAAENTPQALKGNPEAVQNALMGGAEMAGGAALGTQALSGQTPIQDTLRYNKMRLRSLRGSLVTPTEAAELPAAASRVPALRVSSQDVINEAAAEGIDLTPAQATRQPWAQTIQGVGEKTTLPGGQALQDAMQDMRLKFEQSVEGFVKRADPFNLGASKTMAGSHLQESAKMAMENARTSADVAYHQAGLDQANLAVRNSGDLKTWVDSLRNVRQPGAAVARPEYQTPAVNSAMNDIADAPTRLGTNPSVQSMRNLRTEFWEKSQDYSGQIPDSARRLYSQAASKVDDMIMDAAKGTNFENSFRDASSQWKALKQKYDTPGTPLNRILNANDSQSALDQLVNRKHAEDITALKNEGIDLGPVKNQVVQDIAGKSFRVRGNTLAGYPHEFLNELFGPQATQELYVKGELARRMNVEVNPSGTGRINIARDEIGWKPWNWVRGEAAARASMPQNPKVYIGSKNLPATAMQKLRTLSPSAVASLPISSLIGER